jgi:ABC-type transporter Mla subunit MlaD
MPRDGHHAIAFSELAKNPADLTGHLLQTRTEIRALIAGAYETLAKSRLLIEEVDTRLAKSQATLIVPIEDGWV